MMPIDKTGRKKIHTRQIDIATYEKINNSIIVEGILHDKRLAEVYQPNGEKKTKGTVHHLIIRLQINLPDLAIKDIEVEMPTIPRDECRETIQCLAPIKGVRIVSGFTARVKNLVGGTKGCYHLLALLTAMAPAAVQGAWNAMARKPVDPKKHIPVAIKKMRNTCHVWREDGPLVKGLQKIYEEG